MELGIGSYTILLDISLFESLSMLGLVALTVASFLFMKKMRKERTVKLGNYNTLKEVHGMKTAASPAVLLVKTFTVISLFLVATGSIQISSTSPVSDTDFVIAMDNSQTMNIPDYSPNRLEFAVGQTVDWIDRLPENTQVSAIAFGGGATPLTTPGDQTDAVDELQQLDITSDGVGKATGDAVFQGVNILRESENEKGKIIVITDGQQTIGRNLSEGINHAIEHDIAVDIVGLSETDATERLYQQFEQTLEESGFDSDKVQAPEINEDKLTRLAESTGGSYYKINDEGIMENILEQIVMEEDSVTLNSSFYILMALSILMILEMLLYSKYGAI